MSRVDWKRGRFDTQYEVNQVEDSLRAYQGSEIGDSVQYYRFDFEDSQADDIYDEGYGTGLVFHEPLTLPALHVTHNEGGRDGQGEGFYFNDDLLVVTSYDLFTRTGMERPDVQHQVFLKDRIIYDEVVFRVTDIQILGQVNERDTTVSIEATQVKPDEMTNDPQFAQWAQQPWPNPWPKKP